MSSRWRLSIVAWAVLALTTAAGAQEPVSVVARVVASGNVAPPRDVQGVESEVELQQLLHELGWHEPEFPRIDFQDRRVVLLALGRGRGAPVAVTQVGQSEQGVVRLTGAPGSQIVPKRWAVVAIGRTPADALPWFETDCVLTDGAAGVRTLAETPAIGRPLESHWDVDRVPWPGGDALPQPFLATDRVTLERLAKEHLGRRSYLAVQPYGMVDFRSEVVLFLPATVQKNRPEPPLRCLPTATGALLRHAGGQPVPRLIGRAVPGRPSTTYRAYRVPRRAGKLELERQVIPGKEPVGRVVRRWRPVANFLVPRPRHQALLPILRTSLVRPPGPGSPRAVGSAAVAAKKSPQRAPHDMTVCRRATTIAEWRELRREVSEFSQLPVDWGDFDQQDVVVVANSVGARSPLLGFAVSEEEGVDVVTITEVAPAPGAAPCANGCAFLVPKRKGQLAVVWRDARVPLAPVETTLRVFPGDGR